MRWHVRAGAENAQRMKLFILAVGACLLLAGCEGNFPKDPERTLEKAKQDQLVVGYSENPPWVVKGDTAPTGIEPDLVRAFASSIGARVRWQNDTEQKLFEDLEEKKVHLVIAGITQKTPWKKKVALTRPYLKQGKEKHVMAAIRGENAFIVALERFLHAQEPQLKQTLGHETDR
ncbi:transporter substrate-binding domain-containing protein [Pontibacter mangrovi]|uniref:Amino acid ABC transporter substrate-binding protein n=1 Tax=Pontibacter mangrovi TaxID=2589816 RepID=A0A501W5Z7_9BACT|nr:transporter substrate-binding domain-containing protein [Pontibacter mangrovi]TPE41036.1 amino acid ABC transporter substrate-binding protein [Pontibacter mangrovi]